MNKYKLIHTSQLDGSKTFKIFEEDICTDVVRNIYYFLLSVSFAKQNILEAFEEVADEYKEEE